jgi:RNA polymerase sigma-70 factor (ECF subfamily)
MLTGRTKENGQGAPSIQRMAAHPGATIEQLEELYRTRRPQFLRVAAAITRDPDRAADAVQEAFGRAIRRRSTYGGHGTIEAWTWTFVVRAARDQCETVRPEPPPHEQETTNGHREPTEVATAIALLPERQRLVLFLRYYADLDYAAIAAVLGIAEGTVAATLHAAHRAVHRRLEEALT